MRIDKQFEGQDVVLTTKFGEKIKCRVLEVKEKEIRIMTVEPPTRQVISVSIISRIEQRL